MQKKFWEYGKQNARILLNDWIQARFHPKFCIRIRFIIDPDPHDGRSLPQQYFQTRSARPHIIIKWSRQIIAKYGFNSREYIIKACRTQSCQGFFLKVWTPLFLKNSTLTEKKNIFTVKTPKHYFKKHSN